MRTYQFGDTIIDLDQIEAVSSYHTGDRPQVTITSKSGKEYTREYDQAPSAFASKTAVISAWEGKK